MASTIDVTKPTEGKAYTVDVRNNFTIIKTEIELLQDTMASISSDYLSLDGGILTGTLTVFGSLTGGISITSQQDVLGGGTNILIRPPAGTTARSGGSVSINGGAAGPNGGNGGTISLSSGSGTSGGGVPGNVIINGGFGYHNDGGSIILSPGGVSGATSYGSIQFRYLAKVAQSNADAIWNNNGVLNIGAGATNSFLPLPFGVTQQTNPLVILEKDNVTNSVPLVPAQGNTVLNLYGGLNSNTRLQINAHGAAPILDGYATGGFVAGNINATNANRNLLVLTGGGYDGTAYAGGRAGQYAVAGQTWTPTAQGALWRWTTTQNDTVTSAERMRLTDTGTLLIGQTAAAGTAKLQVTGDSTITGTLTAKMLRTVTPDLNWAGLYSISLKVGDTNNAFPGMMFQSNDPKTIVFYRWGATLYLSSGTATDFTADLISFDETGITTYVDVAFNGKATLSSDPTQPMQAATKQYVDTHPLLAGVTVTQENITELEEKISLLSQRIADLESSLRTPTPGA